MSILVSGGLGFIGSHVCVELARKGYHIVVVDNLSNADPSITCNIKTLWPSINWNVYFNNVGDRDMLKDIFVKHRVDWVIHMAGSKSVAESVHDPLKYYQNNICNTVALLEVMKAHGCKKIVFSSSATVYGQQAYPVDEEAPTGQKISSPYGKTKYMIEEMLKDVYAADNSWQIVILRYFNPIGSHPSGLLRESCLGTPNNLFPFIVQVAQGKRECLTIYGNDYETKDGTCIRDFVHVMDVAAAHCVCLDKIKTPGLRIYNVGTGVGTSVMELITCFNKANNKDIPFRVAARREGDLPVVYANVDKIKRELGWVAEKTLREACF